MEAQREKEKVVRVKIVNVIRFAQVKGAHTMSSQSEVIKGKCVCTE